MKTSEVLGAPPVLTWLLVVVLLLFILFAGRLFLRQDRLIFRPGPSLARSPADLGLSFEARPLDLGDGTVVESWWVPFPGSGQAVLYLHGSEGNLTHELATVQFCQSLKVSALLVEYPGYGRSDGRPTEAGCYRAAEAAWHHLREERGRPPEAIFIFGHSLGSAVGVYLAASRPSGGLALHSGFTSVPDLAARVYPYLPVRPFLRTRMNSLARIGQCRCPLLVMHSADDEHIPIEQARRLYRQAPGPKKLVILEGSHFGSRWQRSAEVRAAWQELLSGRVGEWEGGAGGAEGSGATGD